MSHYCTPWIKEGGLSFCAECGEPLVQDKHGGWERWECQPVDVPKLGTDNGKPAWRL